MLFTCRMDLDRILKTEKIPFQMFVFSLFCPRFPFREIEILPDFCSKSRLWQEEGGAVTNCSVETIASQSFL